MYFLTYFSPWVKAISVSSRCALTRAPLGYSAIRAQLRVGVGAYSAPPPSSSELDFRTDGGRKTGKTEIESSQQVEPLEQN